MDGVERLKLAMARAIASQCLGECVACRVLADRTDSCGDLDHTFGRYLELAGEWMGVAPLSVSAWRDDPHRRWTALVTYRHGRTATIVLSTHADHAAGVDVLLVCARGVTSWTPDRDDPNWSVSAEAPLSAEGAALLSAARRSNGMNDTVPLETSDDDRTSPKDWLPPRDGAMRRPLIEVKAPRREPPLGVLLVSGAHTHQEMYAASFAADERCRLVGLTDERQIDDRRRGLNLLLAARLGVPWFDDLDAALARDDVSIACICAEPERRAPLIVRAARAGKHVYLDKPLAASICEAEAIVSAIEKSQVISQMYSMVGWRVAQRLRAAIESGEVGQPLALHYDLFFAKGHTGTARLSDAQPREKQPTDFERFDAKRELYNIGVYPLVTLAWLFRTGVARVTATTGNYFFAEHQARGFEDFAQVVVECADGLLATINVGRTGWHSHPSAGVHRATLIGSRGRITADLHSPRIETWSAMSRWDAPARHTADPAAFWPSTQQESGIRPKTAWTNPYELGDDVRRFVDFVERGQASDVDASLAADVLEWLLAAYQSAAEGRAVNLPLPRDG